MPQSANLGAIGNVAGATFRLDANSAFQALASSSSGASVPDPTYPFQLWWDTSVSPHLLKQRTPANNGWAIVGEWTGGQYRPRRDGVALGTAAVEAAGSGANQLVKLDANGRLPALDASQLLNLPAVSATGDLRLTFESTAPSGWLFCDGTTIGTVASGASHAGTSYETLFAYLWNRITGSWCPVFTSGGGSTTRGVSAAYASGECRG